jgi:hypothetical protein
MPEGLAHCVPVHAITLGQGDRGRQRVARLVFALLDRGCQRVGDPAPCRAAIAALIVRHARRHQNFIQNV